MTHQPFRGLVGLHRISWRATATALSNLDAIADGLAWLVGDPDEVELDRTASYHGPEVVLIDARTTNKKRALASLARLGEHNIQHLLASLEQRLDEQHVLHFRLELNALVDGEVVLAETSGTSTVKGQAKFEVYPGQPAADQIHDTIDIALNMAKEKGRDGA
ncbi:MAG: hypothetical protein DWC10_07595 [Candidatus Poseidoniales archaeon]|nr:MAG: hypothetical protein DWC10_07595 [Candidatus Poseidoniales archaeon]